jgi:hypothetical protein
MRSRTPSIIAGLSTFFIVVAVAILFVFGQIALLNGANESQAFNALVISAIFQAVVLLIAVILARWLPNLFIARFNWNSFLAVGTAVIVSAGLGGLLAFLSVILSTLLAGIS